MNSKFLSIILIFITIAIFTLLNILLKSKNIKENYGVYCGRYNLNASSAQKYCNADVECKWNMTIDPNTGLANNWCSQNPNPSVNNSINLTSEEA